MQRAGESPALFKTILGRARRKGLSRFFSATGMVPEPSLFLTTSSRSSKARAAGS